MDISEFKKDEDGVYEFGHYDWTNELKTNIGDFELYITMAQHGISPPSNVFELAEQLLSFVQSNTEVIVEAIFEHYSAVRKDNTSWLEQCDVPTDLDPSTVMDYAEDLSLGIAQDLDNPEIFESFVHIVPDWDLEHALFLRLEGGKLVSFDPMSY